MLVKFEKESGVTTLKIYRDALTAMYKWKHQNGATCVDCIEGSLLDSLLFQTPKGTALFQECYINEGMSGYVVKFEKYPSQSIWNEWDRMIQYEIDTYYNGDREAYYNR